MHNTVRMAQLTKRQAAERLRVHPSSVQRMIDAGKLKPHTTITTESGRVLAYLFRESDVDRQAARRAA